MSRARVFAATLLVSFGLALGLCLAPVSARADEPVAETEATPTPTPEALAGEEELAELGQREAAAPQLQEFEGGGDGIYISSSAIILILVVVIIVIVVL